MEMKSVFSFSSSSYKTNKTVQILERSVTDPHLITHHLWGLSLATPPFSSSAEKPQKQSEQNFQILGHSKDEWAGPELPPHPHTNNKPSRGGGVLTWPRVNLGVPPIRRTSSGVCFLMLISNKLLFRLHINLLRQNYSSFYYIFKLFNVEPLTLI